MLVTNEIQADLQHLSNLNTTLKKQILRMQTFFGSAFFHCFGEFRIEIENRTLAGYTANLNQITQSKK